jgi:hypothetical protein
MRELLEKALRLEEAKTPLGVTVDVLASLRLHDSEA